MSGWRRGRWRWLTVHARASYDAPSPCSTNVRESRAGPTRLSLGVPGVGFELPPSR